MRPEQFLIPVEHRRRKRWSSANPDTGAILAVLEEILDAVYDGALVEGARWMTAKTPTRTTIATPGGGLQQVYKNDEQSYAVVEVRAQPPNNDLNCYLLLDVDQTRNGLGVSNVVVHGAAPVVKVVLLPGATLYGDIITSATGTHYIQAVGLSRKGRDGIFRPESDR